ncbi:uncharacterized protein ACRADG_000166 [Cochliomyia hominivorax]
MFIYNSQRFSYLFILILLNTKFKNSNAQWDDCNKMTIEGGATALKRIFDDFSEMKAAINELRSSNSTCQTESGSRIKDLPQLDLRYDSLPKKCALERLPKDCAEATVCTDRSGIYILQVPQYSSGPFYVECDVETENGDWILIQKRFDGSIDFNRNWEEYENGFGDIDGEFFIGLKKLYALTNYNGPQELMIIMKDAIGTKAYAKYDIFAIANDTELYKLKRLGEYTGTAGDSLRSHLGMNFTTKDRDNDLHASVNCADHLTGAWWHRNCHQSHLNGKFGDNTYGKGINWFTFRGHNASLKYTKMMLRRLFIQIFKCRDIKMFKYNSKRFSYIFVVILLNSIFKNTHAQWDECNKITIEGGSNALKKIFDDFSELKTAINELKSRNQEFGNQTETRTKDLPQLDLRYDSLPKICAQEKLPNDCAKATACTHRSGIYILQIPQYNFGTFYVECDADTENGDWLLIQRRHDGSVDFFRDWNEYEEGFGDVDGEFFIGLKKLHALTNYNGPQELMIVMEDVNGTRAHAKYDTFAIGNDTESYKLKKLGKYTGTAGDSLKQHLGMKFSTKDRDNDVHATQNCAALYTGAWWYTGCHKSNLNGKYGDNNHGKGINWYSYRGHTTSLSYTKMMIRRRRSFT